MLVCGALKMDGDGTKDGKIGRVGLCGKDVEGREPF